MKKLINTFGALLIALFLLLVSFYSLLPQGKTEDTGLETWRKISNLYQNTGMQERVPVAKEVQANINALPIQDNKMLYQNDQPGSVVVMYLTIRKGSPFNNKSYTWEEINKSIKFLTQEEIQIEVPTVDAILQIGDKIGPLSGELGYAETIPNANVSIRGNTTSLAAQKSYKIELTDKKSQWRGQETIALNKHIYDSSRSINKLAFDLMKEIPNMVSLRTQFVHLYVKDETASTPQKIFQDYGLFTQIEQPNTQFLKNHLLDRNAQLYKATDFEFYRYPDEIRLVDDPAYNVKEFSRILEIKGNQNHAKLIQMLDDVNNFDLPIDKTFNKYFNSDNYFTWMSFNILVGNIDTASQNFYLYSPQNGDKWYFLPWDYDDSFSRQEENNSNYTYPWGEGISSYWGVVLHQRVLSHSENRRILDQKVNELLIFLSNEKIKKMLDLYYPVTREFVSRMPDLKNVTGSVKAHDQRYNQIPNEVQINYKLYKESLDKPMPFFLGEAKRIGEKIEFTWDKAYDLDNQKISYQFMVSTDPDFKNVITNREGLNLNRFDNSILNPGTYYWRVIASNTDGKRQVAFNNYIDGNGIYHFGTKFFHVTPEGLIHNMDD